MKRLATNIARTAANTTARAFFLRFKPERSHRLMEKTLACLDDHPRCLNALGRLGLKSRTAAQTTHTQIGNVSLPSPLILGAGLVKGHGFTRQADALAAVARGENIIPGWRSVPAIAGAVEFGSFTPQPRPGNSGPILWRDRRRKNLHNRVGLRNPGIAAATEFLSARTGQLPEIWGVSLAPDPEEADRQRRLETLAGAARALADRGLTPSWVTVNLSCPNAEPEAGQRLPDTQSPDEARQLCAAVRRELPAEVSIWAKVGPGFSAGLYVELAHALAQAGTEAVIATNTLAGMLPGASPPNVTTPGDPRHTAGMGGAGLLPHALRSVQVLSSATQNLPLDVIGCGGVMDGNALLRYQLAGAKAVQYWSALVYRGPLAADIISREVAKISATGAPGAPGAAGNIKQTHPKP